MIPAILAGRYRVDDLLGQDGLGGVSPGFDTVLQRRVAILPEDAGNRRAGACAVSL